MPSKGQASPNNGNKDQLFRRTESVKDFTI